MKPHILIIGASARAAAFSALRAGLSCETADLFADLDLRRRCDAVRVENYPRDLWRFVEDKTAQDANRPLAWMYTGGLENYPARIDRLSGVAQLLGAGAAAVRSVRDPFLLAAALREAGLRFPESVRVGRAVGAAGAEFDGGPWLWKPFRSSGGGQVRRVMGSPFDSCGERSDTHRGGSRTSSPGYYQRHISGTPCGAVYVASRGGANLVGVSEQLIGRDWGAGGDFAYAGSAGPLALGPPLLSQFHRIGQALCNRFPLVGLFGVDAILHGEQVHTLEVNPRYTASVEVLERALNLRAIELHLRACLESNAPVAETTREDSAGANSFCGKLIIYAQGDLVVPPAFEAYALVASAESDWPKIADIPAAGAHIAAGHPITTVLAAGDSVEAVKSALRQRAGGLRERFFSESS